MLTIDLAFLSFVLGSVIPIAVAFLAKLKASSALKATLNALLALVAGLASAAQVTDGVISKTGAIAVFYAWVASQAAHYGLLKPIKLTGSEGVIQQKLRGGIG